VPHLAAFLAAGAKQLIHWINRPTYQEVTEVQGPSPR
jgi:hypothetical protein